MRLNGARSGIRQNSDICRCSGIRQNSDGRGVREPAAMGNNAVNWWAEVLKLRCYEVSQGKSVPPPRRGSDKIAQGRATRRSRGATPWVSNPTLIKP